MSTKKFGLIGKNISYSFSKSFFNEKFERENLKDCTYENFDFQDISELPILLKNNPNINGMNVTIPYKEAIIPYLNKLSKKASKIGAVNVVKISKKGKLKGYNSDCYGFKKALQPLLQKHHKKALILGTGGASKGVAFALEELGIEYAFVSRSGNSNTIPYDKIDQNTFDEYQIFINASPVGTFPNIEECPDLPYQFFTKNHIAFDLIYNPEVTEFLKRANEKESQTKNGYDMLVFQAEKSWDIWNR